jgi:7,8-dihydropterin-6-yl-methyl-4-(beta-D-ribofuranosyl)aminobenzene 5'-phosphate synthase
MGRARTAAVCSLGAAAATTAALLPSVRKFERQRAEADRLWDQATPAKLQQPDAVSTLSVLPLVDYFTADASLQGEAGVSYLVRADDTTILFDVGFNQKRRSPSPLAHNMQALGVRREEIDAVVISHRHVDHIGGLAAQKARTFTITPGDTEPLDVPAYVPDEMTHPSARVTLVREPRRLAPGVFSIGGIARSLWLVGMVWEQALAVNVAGKGIVLVIGCGHQTLERAIARTEALFDEPLYGVIGGLHFPVTGSRIRGGVQRVIGTGRLPWQRIGKDDVHATVAHLAGKDPKLVAISPHDSCDWAVDQFRAAFPGRYEDVLVGREIAV